MKIKLDQTKENQLIRVNAMGPCFIVLAKFKKTVLVQNCDSLELELLSNERFVISVTFDNRKYFYEDDNHLNSWDL